MPRGRGLSRQQIVSAALAVVDADGIEALSMRRLGRELGVEAMSLYHHVASKAELLDALVDGVVQPLLDALPVELGWQDLLRGLGHSMHAALSAHPGLTALIGTRPVRSDASMTVVEAGVARMVEQGFDERMALRLLNIVATFVIGHTLSEHGRTPGESEEAVSGIPEASTHPLLTAAVAAGPEYQERFETGLELIVSGAEALRRDAQ